MKNKFEVGELVLHISRSGECSERVIDSFIPYDRPTIFSSFLQKSVKCSSKYLYDIGSTGIGANGTPTLLWAEEDMLRKIYKPSSQSFTEIIQEIKSSKPIEV